MITDWKHGPHRLTYWQTERTCGLVAAALAKDEPDGRPSQALQAVCDDLLEASIPGEFKDASTSLAVDWTDLESFSRPPPARGGDCADSEASWGHRKNNLLRSEDELFFGYYLSAGIMMPGENSPAVPEFARHATMSSCRHDPVRALAPVLTAMPASGIPLGDVLADSGYAHRDADAWAIPLRAAGASPGPGPARPRPQGHPRRRHHRQWQPNGHVSSHRYSDPGLGAFDQDSGACLPDPCLPCPLARLRPRRRSAGSGDRGGGSRCRVTRKRQRGVEPSVQIRAARRLPPPRWPCATRRAGCGQSWRRDRYGWSWPVPPAGWTPHADGSRRAPARTGALRAAEVTNGQSDGGACEPFH